MVYILVKRDKIIVDAAVCARLLIGTRVKGIIAEPCVLAKGKVTIVIVFLILRDDI